MQKLILICSILTISVVSQTQYYNYNYQNYPVHFDQLYQGRPANGGAFGNNTPMDQMLLQSAMRSLIKPGVSPNQRVSRSSFLNEWNSRFGYNFMSLEAVQENIGCRARCRRMSSSPVCGDNMTRYFNSCDAECDQVSYGTENLRYNNRCCCTDDMMALTSSSLYCVVTLPWTKGGADAPKMIMNHCMMNCLQKNGDSIAQDNDSIVGC